MSGRLARPRLDDQIRPLMRPQREGLKRRRRETYKTTTPDHEPTQRNRQQTPWTRSWHPNIIRRADADATAVPPRRAAVSRKTERRCADC